MLFEWQEINHFNSSIICAAMQGWCLVPATVVKQKTKKESQALAVKNKLGNLRKDFFVPAR